MPSFIIFNILVSIVTTGSLSPRNSVGGDIVMRPFVCGWASPCVRARVRLSVALCPVDTMQTTVFAQLLSYFTCKLSMMWWGTLLILGHGVKGQGQIWHFVYKTLWTRYRLQFLPNHFQTSRVSCSWWDKEPYWFGITRSNFKVNLGHLRGDALRCLVFLFARDFDKNWFTLLFGNMSHIWIRSMQYVAMSMEHSLTEP